MNLNDDQRIADYRKRQSVLTRKYGVGTQRKQSWAQLLRGIASVETAYAESDKLPNDLVQTFYELSKYANEQYGKLVDFLTSIEVELHDVDAKIRVVSEE